MLVVLLIAPIISTIVSAIFRKNLLIAEVITLLSSFIQLAASVFIANTVIQTGTYSLHPFFYIDHLGALLLLITSVVGFVSISFNIGYIREEVKKEIIGIHRATQSYLLINLFLLAMLSAIASTNPIFTWITIEATTLSTIFLISFYNKPSATEAAWKYLVVNSVGLMLAFLGTILYLAAASHGLGERTATWDNLASSLNGVNVQAIKIAFILVLIGYGTKLGIAPMHTWRPDAYSKAPIPVVAMLSGALLNVAFLAILRFKVITDNAIGGDFTQNLFIFFGILSVVLAALIIYRQENYKRLLAYSSVEHAGIMLLGVGFGGLGVYASLLHMIHHSLAKSLIFLLSGNIFLKYSSAYIKDVGGVLNTLPQTAVLFVLAFLALVGLPPFGIFLTKFYIILAGIQTHPWVTLIMVFSLALIFLGFFRLISSMLFGKIPDGIKSGEYSKWNLLPPVLLLCLIIILSVYLPDPLQKLLNNASEGLRR